MKARNRRVPLIGKAVRKLSLVPIFLAFSITLLHSFVPHTHCNTGKSGFTQNLPYNPWLMWLTLDLGAGHLGQYENNGETEEVSSPLDYLLRADISHTLVADTKNTATSFNWPAIFSAKIKNLPGKYFSLRAPPLLA